MRWDEDLKTELNYFILSKETKIPRSTVVNKGKLYIELESLISHTSKYVGIRQK